MSLSLVPKNRHLLVDLLVDEEKNSGILLPDDYKKVEEFKLVRLLDIALDVDPDVRDRYTVGEVLAVHAHTLQEIKVGTQSFHTVLENYVIGTVKGI